MPESLNIFGGRGFIGSAYHKLRPTAICNARDDYEVHGTDVVYFISTTHNYNVLEGNVHLDVDVNLKVLLSVLQSIKHPESTTFNFISSWFVYGKTDLPATETSYCDPRGFYSITKRAAEQLLISYCETMGIKYRILRLANIIGPTDVKVSNKRNALQYMINRLRINEPISLYDDGNMIRDYMDLEDCVRAIDIVVTTGEVNSIYNIGNGLPINVKDVILYAKDKLKSSSPIEFTPTPEFHKTVQVKSMYMDTTKLQALGYKPSYTMEQSIDKILHDGVAVPDARPWGV